MNCIHERVGLASKYISQLIVSLSQLVLLYLIYGMCIFIDYLSLFSATVGCCNLGYAAEILNPNAEISRLYEHLFQLS